MINYIEEMQLNELYHHGIQGQKWGVRRYQNADGTLTVEGRKRYGVDYLSKSEKKVTKAYAKAKRLSDVADNAQEKAFQKRNAVRVALESKMRKKQENAKNKYEKLKSALSKESMKTVNKVVKDYGKLSMSKIPKDVTDRANKYYHVTNGISYAGAAASGFFIGGLPGIATTLAIDAVADLIGYTRNPFNDRK